MRGRKPFSLPYILFTLITFMFPAPGSAQDSTSVPGVPPLPTFTANEVSLGIGAAYSPEKDVFNVQDDVAAGTNASISLAYLRNLNAQFALGINLYGYFKSVNNVQIITSTGSGSYTLNVSTLNVGVECRYTFSRESSIRPYALVLLSYVSGDLSNDELGSLSITGFAGGGGLGADVSLGDSWGLALEATASVGTAEWEKPPFTNSTSADFNPTMFMILLRTTYLWE